jgi:hypothetical protein
MNLSSDCTTILSRVEVAEPPPKIETAAVDDGLEYTPLRIMPFGTILERSGIVHSYQ